MTGIYRSSPEDYLDRARRCLGKARPDYLFYAAFELRCCVEKIQDLYLDAQESYRKTLPKRWNIGKQNTELSRIFEKEEAQIIKCKFKDGRALEFIYVPVPDKLNNKIEKLGQYLHSCEGEQTPNDQSQLREKLQFVYENLEKCVTGNCWCPIMIDKKTNSIIGKFILDPNKVDIDAFKRRIVIDAKISIEVRYTPLDSLIIQRPPLFKETTLSTSWSAES